MKGFFPIFVFLPLFTLCCATSVPGINVRARSPLISEASRRLLLALRADDYVIEKGSALGLYHLTRWRPLKEGEESEREFGNRTNYEARVEVKLQPRGSLYDIIVTISLRGSDGEYMPDVNHPIVVKWQRILDELVEVESREEG